MKKQRLALSQFAAARRGGIFLFNVPNKTDGTYRTNMADVTYGANKTN